MLCCFGFAVLGFAVLAAMGVLPFLPDMTDMTDITDMTPPGPRKISRQPMRMAPSWSGDIWDLGIIYLVRKGGVLQINLPTGQ